MTSFYHSNCNSFTDFDCKLGFKHSNSDDNSEIYSNKCSDNCSDCCSDSDSYTGNCSTNDSVNCSTNNSTNNSIYSLDVDVAKLIDELTCVNGNFYDNLEYIKFDQEQDQDQCKDQHQEEDQDNYINTYCSYCYNYKNLNIKHKGVCQDCWHETCK